MLRRTYAFASIAFALSMLAATDAAATAQRTFVASYGSPTNTTFNCSVTKPCRAFSEAISVTNNNGEVIVLDSAGYGPVTITQSVKIIAPSGVYAGVSVSSGDGIVVNGGGINVVLRGLTINGQGGANGITVVAANELHVENCVVSGMAQRGIEFAAGTALLIKDSIIRDNGQIGIHITGYATIERSRIERSGYEGLRLEGGKVSIVDTTVSQNSGDGIYMPSLVDVSVERTVIQGNVGYGIHEVAGSLRTNRTVITGNAGTGVYALGSAQLTQTDISANTLDGITVNDPGDVVLAGCSINRNGKWGIDQLGGIVYTVHDNVAYGNGIADTFGSLTTLTPK